MQVPGGAVFASRTPRWTLAAVAKRGALSSLMLYDLRAVLGELEGGPPIRRSASVAPAADEEHGRGGIPMPELGRVKEKRKGPLSRAAGIAEGMAATVRRMQREREPRVLVYDPAGYARLIQPEARGHERIMEVAEEMLALVAEPRVTLVDPELAARVLERALARGGDMAELYAESRRGFAISLDDGRVERPQGGRERGACVRVVQGDSTYYGHVDGLAEEDLLRVAGSVSEAVRGEATHPAALGPREPGTRPRDRDAARRTWRPAARRSCCERATSAPAPRAPRSRRRASATPRTTARSRSTAPTGAPPPTTAPASG